MKLLLSLSLVLLHAVSASAKPIQVLIGPYSLSFDPNAPRAPSFITSISKNSGSIQYVAQTFRGNNVRATLNIIKFNEWQYAGFPDAMARWLLYSSMNRSVNIKSPGTTKMIVDGKQAMVASNINPTSSDYNIMAEYWKDRSKMAVYGFPVSKAKVELISTLPKDQIGSLMNTLGIKSSGQRTGSQGTGLQGSGKQSQVPVMDEECVSDWMDMGCPPEQILLMGSCVNPGA